MRLLGDGSQVLPGTVARGSASGVHQSWQVIVLDKDGSKESEKGYQEDDEAEVGAQCGLRCGFFGFSCDGPIVQLRRHCWLGFAERHLHPRSPAPSVVLAYSCLIDVSVQIDTSQPLKGGAQKEMTLDMAIISKG